MVFIEAINRACIGIPRGPIYYRYKKAWFKLFAAMDEISFLAADISTESENGIPRGLHPWRT